MAKIVKKVDRIIPSTQRSQVFTSVDASTGDILDLYTTLGKNAALVRIETVGSSDLSIRRNVSQTIFAQRTDDIFSGPLTGGNINTASGMDITDQSVAAEIIGPGSGQLLGPVKDLEVTWTTGTWTIIAS